MAGFGFEPFERFDPFDQLESKNEIGEGFEFGNPIKTVKDIGRIIDDQLDLDERKSGALDRASSTSPISQSAYVFAEGHFEEIKSKNISFPEIIAKEYQDLKCKSFLGLLPEINRAYITIDNKLFLWNYNEGKTVVSYDKLFQIIISVTIAKPKPGIFVDEVKHVLVIATPVEIVLLGCVFENGDVNGNLSLYETQFSTPSDNVHMLKMVGTDTGRILMGGKDGSLYELEYQAQSGWFSRKCRKTNHSKGPIISALVPSFLYPGVDPIVDLVIDPSRTPQLLYSLSKGQKTHTPTIQVFSLGNEGKDLVFRAKSGNIWEQCNRLLRKCDREIPLEFKSEQNFEITSIAPILQYEANETLVVGITHHGHRIYFSMNKGSGLIQESDELKVRLIRLTMPRTRADGRKQSLASPGPMTPEHGRDSPKDIRKAFYGNGILVLADTDDFARDNLITVIRDDHKNDSDNVEELVHSFLLNERICDISEYDRSFYLKDPVAKCLYPKSGGSLALLGLPELAVQHAVAARHFLVLTSKGIHVYKKRRPKDDLVSILSQTRNTANEQLNRFVKRYTISEFCAMCLNIACEPTPQDSKSGVPAPVKILASEAFFNYGLELARKPTDIFRIYRYSTDSTALEDGLSLYLSRLLRPVWNWPLVSDKGKLSLRFTNVQYQAFYEQLKSLKKFIKKNEGKFESFISYAATEQLKNKYPKKMIPKDLDEKKLIAQQRSQLRNRFDLYYRLLDLCLQIFYFLLTISSSGAFPLIASNLSDGDSEELRTTALSKLVTLDVGEQRIVRAMIEAILKVRNIPPEIIDNLAKSCPQYFKNTDVIVFRALEKLERARGAESSEEKENMIKEALEEYKLSARDTDFQIENICEKLREIHSFSGAIEICLYRIEQLKKGEVALPKEIDTKSEEEPQAWIREEIEKCFQVIEDTFELVVFPSSVVSLIDKEREKKRDKVMNQCLEIKDKDLHFRLYEWLIKHRDNAYCKKRLMTISPRYLVPYLSHNIQRKEVVEILKDYYNENNMYEQATILLSDLANHKEQDYTLEERLAFLERAKVSAELALRNKRDEQSELIIDEDTLTRLEAKIEIARVQKDVLESLRAKQEEIKIEAKDLASLSNSLLLLDDLYSLAVKYKLWESILGIFNVADENNNGDIIETIWKNIIRSETQRHLEGKRMALPVQNKVISLGRLYASKRHLFPLEAIIKELEDVAILSEIKEANYVVNTLLEAQADRSELLEIYERLLRLREHEPARRGSFRRLCVENALTLLEALNREDYFSVRGRSVVKQAILLSIKAYLDTTEGPHIRSYRYRWDTLDKSADA